MKKLLFVVAIAACGGGGSGIDTGKKLVSLSSSEVMTECQYIHDQYPARMVTCGTQTVTINNQTVAQCVTNLNANITSSPNCTATVGDAENCIADEEALPDSAFCMSTAPPASCAKLSTTECGG